MSKLKKLKCGCKVMENGWLYSECKYHKTHCHWFVGCKRKLKKDEYDYCKEHGEYMDSQADPEGYGGSDF